MQDNEMHRVIGSLEANVKSQNESLKSISQKLDSLTDKVEKANSRSIRNGTICGGLAALALTFAKSKLGIL